jgi:hypothetical protein
LSKHHHVDDNLKRRGTVAVVLLHHLHVAQSPVPSNLLFCQPVTLYPPPYSNVRVVVVELQTLDMTSAQNLPNERTDTVHCCR